MKLQKHWYLGFLGLVAFYKLPTLWAAFNGAGHWSDFLNVLWLLWFLYFAPEDNAGTENQ